MIKGRKDKGIDLEQAGNNAVGNNSAVPEAKPKAKWFLSYMLSNVATGLTTPLIPLFVIYYLKSNVVFVGLVSSIASAASVPALLFWGNLSDTVGRRKIFLMIGFTGSFVSLLPILFVRQIDGYIAVLVIFQILAMASVPVSTLLIMENTQESEWPGVMSTFNMISSVGTVAGLAAGTGIIMFLSRDPFFSLPLVYIMAAFVYLSAAASAFLLLPEPARTLRRSAFSHIYSIRTMERLRYFPSNVIHIIAARTGDKTRKLKSSLKKYIYSTALLMFGFQLFVVPFPVFLIRAANASNTEIFIMYLINSILSTLTFRVAGATVKHFGGKKTLSASLFARVGIFGASAVMPYLFMPRTGVLLASLVVYGLIGAIWSFISISQVTYVSTAAVPKNRGKAVGYYNSLLGIGQISGASLSGVISGYLGFGPDFAISAVVVAVGALLILRFYKAGKVTGRIIGVSA